MLSYDLTARKLSQVRNMDCIFNCCGAKATTQTYEPLRWKKVRCYDGKVSHDADPWRPDPTSMRLNVPNHKIDLNKPLHDQPWLGEHSIPTAVPCIIKALCICDVFFGFDGNPQSAPVGTQTGSSFLRISSISPTESALCGQGRQYPVLKMGSWNPHYRNQFSSWTTTIRCTTAGEP